MSKTKFLLLRLSSLLASGLRDGIAFFNFVVMRRDEFEDYSETCFAAAASTQIVIIITLRARLASRLASYELVECLSSNLFCLFSFGFIYILTQSE